MEKCSECNNEELIFTTPIMNRNTDGEAVIGVRVVGSILILIWNVFQNNVNKGGSNCDERRHCIVGLHERNAC